MADANPSSFTHHRLKVVGATLKGRGVDKMVPVLEIRVHDEIPTQGDPPMAGTEPVFTASNHATIVNGGRSAKWTNDARDDGESHELPVIDVHSTPLSKDATLYVLVYDAKSLSQARKGAGKNGQEDLRLQCEGFGVLEDAVLNPTDEKSVIIKLRNPRQGTRLSGNVTMDLVLEVTYLLPTDLMRSLNMKKKALARKEKLMKRLEKLQNQEREFDPLVDSRNKADGRPLPGSSEGGPETVEEDEPKSEMELRRDANVRRSELTQAETLCQQGRVLADRYRHQVALSDEVKKEEEAANTYTQRRAEEAAQQRKEGGEKDGAGNGEGAGKGKGSRSPTGVGEGEAKPLSAKEQQRRDKQEALERARGLRESHWLDGVRWRQTPCEWQTRETAALNALFPPSALAPKKKLMEKGKPR